LKSVDGSTDNMNRHDRRRFATKKHASVAGLREFTRTADELEALGLLETVEIDPVTGSKRPPGQPSAMLLGLAIRLQRLLDEWAEDGPDPLGRDELLNALGCPYSVVPEQCRFLRCIYRHFGKNPLLEGVSWTRPDVGF